MDIDYKFAFSVVTFLIASAVGVWNFFMQRSKANADEIHSLDVRLSMAETKIESMPTHTDIKEIHQRINESNKQLDEMGGQLSEINSTMKLMHEYLLKERK